MKKSSVAISVGLALINPRSRGEGDVELEYEYGSAEDIPAEYANLYAEQGGKYVLAKVKGVAPAESVRRLESALAKERNDHRQVKQQISALGRPVEEVLADLDRIPQLEAAANGKGAPEDIEKMVKARLAPIERQLQAVTSERDSVKQEIEGYRTRETKAKIKDAVIAAAAGAKLRPSAIEDAVTYAQLQMTVDDNGNVVTKDGAGVTPYLTPADWLNEILPKRPHWVEGSAGGGASGTGNGGHHGEDPYSHDGWNISKQMNLWKTNQSLAKRLAEKNGVDPLKPVRPAKK
nr:MAG TPA: hypothetical protein [Caudoviricetes sp.]